MINEKSIIAIKKHCNNNAEWALATLEQLLEHYWDEKNNGYVEEVVNDEDTTIVCVDLPDIHELNHYNNFGRAEFPIGEAWGEGSIQIRLCDGGTLSFAGKITGRIYTEWEDMPNDIPDRIITGLIEPYELEIDHVEFKKDVLDAWTPEGLENIMSFKKQNYKPAC